MSEKTESRIAEPRLPLLARHEFLLRRLHSLSGLIPVGAYMCIHLLTNATVLDSPASFQGNVYRIHSLGRFLPLIEWTFIFLPIFFHALYGVVIMGSGVSNSGKYPTTSNVRYTLQRLSGMVAFVFIVWHVFHMHGWLHSEVWLERVKGYGGNFKPYNATSSAGAALQASWMVQVAYALGVLACVFHLANGLWTMGITWGLWISPQAQRRANWLVVAFGIGLATVGLSALGGFSRVNVSEARQEENQRYDARVAAGEMSKDDHKRWVEEDSSGEHSTAEQSHDAAADEQ